MINEKELMVWADKTADAYHNLATDPAHPECNLAFYTQSDLRKMTATPDLLILTINPNGDAGYTGKDGFDGQSDNPTWKNWGLNGRMTGEVLLKGNPFFSNRETWSLWKRLRDIFRRGNIGPVLDDESRFVYTELIFFNTLSSSHIPKEAYRLVPNTIDLINILQPKQILCVGAATCLPALKPYVTGLTQIAKNVKEGKINDIPLFAIPHTASRYTRELLDIAGKTLGDKMIL